MSSHSVSPAVTANMATTPSTVVTMPAAVPGIPGFPWESIVAGLVVGFALLAMIRRGALQDVSDPEEDPIGA